MSLLKTVYRATFDAVNAEAVYRECDCAEERCAHWSALDSAEEALRAAKEALRASNELRVYDLWDGIQTEREVTCSSLAEARAAAEAWARERVLGATIFISSVDSDEEDQVTIARRLFHRLPTPRAPHAGPWARADETREGTHPCSPFPPPQTLAFPVNT